MRPPKTFDVICAGEALWKLAPNGVGLRPGGGAVTVALALARSGLQVGLATVLTDDELGRRRLAAVGAAGVDAGGVVLARPRAGLGLLLVDSSGGANSHPKDVMEQPPLEVPPEWSAKVLLLSGLSPVVAHAAALCRAARAARRAGTFVLIDFNASLHAWAGHDPRTIRMVLREVDAARCSVADLAVLGMDVAMVRDALPKAAELVVSDGSASAIGAGDLFTAGLCAELARAGVPGESAEARWHRAVQGGRAASSRGASGGSTLPRARVLGDVAR